LPATAQSRDLAPQRRLPDVAGSWARRVR
jgi:hypothetical protein